MSSDTIPVLKGALAILENTTARGPQEEVDIRAAAAALRARIDLILQRDATNAELAARGVPKGGVFIERDRPALVSEAVAKRILEKAAAEEKADAERPAPGPESGAQDPKKPVDVILLERALEAVTGERRKSYGDPEDNFALIAEFWNAYLRMHARAALPPGFGINFMYQVTPGDIGAMMALVKVARLARTLGHADSWVDLAGYAAAGARAAGVTL